MNLAPSHPGVIFPHPKCLQLSHSVLSRDSVFTGSNGWSNWSKAAFTTTQALVTEIPQLAKHNNNCSIDPFSYESEQAELMVNCYWQ